MLTEYWRGISIIAGKEFSDRLRNRWMIAIAFLFTIFSVAIAYLGSTHAGVVGIHGIGPAIASLTSLVIYLVPLIALMLGFDAIVGEKERGSLDLLLSMPLSRTELLLGKFLGLALAFIVACSLGFLVVGIILASSFTQNDLYHYIGFVISAQMLGLSFLAIAILISTMVNERSKASGLSIGFWFFFVLIFDLIILGALIGGVSQYFGDGFSLLLLLNPTDVFRLLNVFSIEQVRAFYGLSSLLPNTLSQTGVLTSAMLMWITVPLAAALWRFKR